MAKLKGKISPGCNYVVAAWTKRGNLSGKGNVRHIETCHRTMASARRSLAELRRRIASPKGWAGTIADTLMLKRVYGGTLRAEIYKADGKRMK